MVRNKNEVIATSIIARMEVVAALHRKYREGDMTHAAILRAHDQFLREIEVGRITPIGLTPAAVERVEVTFRMLPSTTFLRASDAFHLATAVENNFKEIYSNDKHLLAAASIFKLKGVNPLAPKTSP
jgi:predicted nucleic acid-binding protein